jgi:uncharacterized protein (TIGR02145 family)
MKNNSAIYRSTLSGFILRIFPTIFIGVFILLINSCKKEQIPAVTTGHITDITPTSANCIGNVYSGQGELLDRRGICYHNTISVPTLNDGYYEYEFFNQGNFSFHMDQLTPGTKYYLRAYVTPFMGETIYGQVISFSTTGSITGEIEFNSDLTYGSVTDIDHNSYKTIEIGTQTWMAENLKTSRYRDGSSITNVTYPTDWWDLTTQAYCCYRNEATYIKTYGELYNWYAVTDSRNIAPEGWHVPSDAEWTTLINFLGGESIAVGKMKETGPGHWTSPNAAATNSSGFTALPSGLRMSGDATFDFLGIHCYFWSSTEDAASTAWSRDLNYYSAMVLRTAADKRNGFSVRCVKD